MALLADYRRADPRFAFADDDLPSELVLVEVSDVGAGFSFVRGGHDPQVDPELEMVSTQTISTQTGAIIPLARSSLRWVANMLIQGAFRGGYRTFVRLAPARLLTDAGALRFPSLSPATRELGAALWLIPVQLDAVAVPSEGAWVAHRHFADLVAWLQALAGVTGLALGVLPGARVELEIDVAMLLGSIAGDALEVFADPHAPELRYALGRLAEQPVLISAGPHVVELATDPSPNARAAVEAELRARDWLTKAARWRL